MKLHRYSNIILLSFLVIFQHCSVPKDNIDNKPIIKVADYEVVYSDFIEKLHELTANNEERNSDAIGLALLDNYIGAGILINEARKNGYLTKRGFIKSMESYSTQLKIEYSRTQSLEGQKIPVKLKNKIETYYHDQIVVHYIWVPKAYKSLAYELKGIMENGGEIKNIITGRPEYKDWQHLGIRLYQKTPIESIPLSEKILDKVLEMSEQEIQLVKTSSAYHIIKCLYIYKLNGIRKGKNIDDLTLNFKIAYAKEDRAGIVDNHELMRMIEIDNQILNRIEFFIKPLSNRTDSNIVAQFDSIKICGEELLCMVRPLPQKVQSLFRNKSTRVKAVASLIILNYGNQNEGERLDNDSGEIKKEIIQSFLASELAEKPNRDTLTLLAKWLKINESQKKLDTLDIAERDEKFCLSSYDNGKLEKKMNHCETNSSFWLHPEKYCDVDKLKLNFSLLERLEFSDVLKPNNDKILASSENWILRVRDYEEVLKSLSPRSRIELSKNENSIKSIYYIAEKSGNTKMAQKITINYDALGKIDLIGNSIDALSQAITEMAIVGKLGNISLTVSDLRNIEEESGNGTYGEFKNDRIEALKKYMPEKYWLNQLITNRFDNSFFYQKKLKDYENYQLAKMFYESEIFMKPVRVSGNDLHLNSLLRKALHGINTERLKHFLFDKAKQVDIEIDYQLFDQIGFDISKSEYVGFIHPLN